MHLIDAENPVFNVTALYPASAATALALPFIVPHVSAGFPSPAENEMGIRLDFNQHFIKHPEATFFAQVSGDSMVDKRIDHGDILLVDRAITPKDGNIVIARIHSDFCIRVFRPTDEGVWLEPANKKYTPMFIPLESDGEIWGVIRLSLIEHL